MCGPWSVSVRDNTRTGLMTSVSDEPRKSPGGRPMLRGKRRLGLGRV